MIEIARPQPNWINNSSGDKYQMIKEMLFSVDDEYGLQTGRRGKHFPIMENVLLFGWAEIGRIPDYFDLIGKSGSCATINATLPPGNSRYFVGRGGGYPLS